MKVHHCKVTNFVDLIQLTILMFALRSARDDLGHSS